MGYVPFVDHNQINFGYMAVHDNEEKNGNLEYILKEIFRIVESARLIGVRSKVEKIDYVDLFTKLSEILIDKPNTLEE